MKIEIKDNEIVADGKTYVLKEEVKPLPSDPVFEKGQWIIGADGWGPTMPSRVLSINGELADIDMGGCGCGDGKDWCWKDGNYIYWRLATPAEIESHLRKVAEDKGFKDGAKIVGLRFEREGKMQWQTIDNHGMSAEFDRYYAEGDTYNVYDEQNNVWECIYEEGKWAEILPDKKPLPKTKEEIEKIFGAWWAFDGDFKEFMDLYED